MTYSAADVADTTVGEDLWQYEYTVNGPLDAFFAVNLQFGHSSYAQLSVVSNSAPARVDVLLTQPDSFLSSDGAAMITASPSALENSFSAVVAVSFVWTAPGTPGPQLYNLTDDGFNVVVDSDALTTPTSTTPIPEPATVALMLGGLGLFAARWRRPCR